MLPEIHPLIEKLIHPIAANTELRMAAHTVLREKFDANHPGVAVFTARLEAVSRRKFSKLRKVLPWLFAVIVLTVAVYPKLHTIQMTQRLYNDVFSFSGVRYRAPKMPKPSNQTTEQYLLLGYPYDFEQAWRLHELDPQNPAYFAEYSSKMRLLTRTLPPDFLATANRIAPDNAYFTYIAAQQIGRECLTIKRSPLPPIPHRVMEGVSLRPLLSETEFEITNTVAYEESLGLLAKATELPRFETYRNSMKAARARLLPTETISDFTRALLFVFAEEHCDSLRRDFGNLLSARAEQLSKSGRKEEFLALVAQREVLIDHLGSNPDITISAELNYFEIARCTSMNFEAAAARLGLTELAKTYRNQGDAFQRESDLRDIRQHEKVRFPVEKISTLYHYTLPMSNVLVSSIPPINNSEFEPMLRAEHELLGGLGILAVALSIALVALLLYLSIFFAKPMIRLPAKFMAGVLNMGDWVWVIGLGVVLPILFYLFVIGHTTLAGRDYSPMYMKLAFPSVQLVALLMTLLIAPASVLRWRLSKNLVFFGFGDHFTILPAVVALAMIAVWSLCALPVMERVMMVELMNDFSFAAVASPLALCFCLLVANIIRTILLGKPAVCLVQCTTAVAALPAYAIAILFLCALTPIYFAGEKRWLAKETLVRIDPDAPHLGSYELKVAAQMRKETNAITMPTEIK
jgi:hypothetical protein